jgi:platelet-activating factor acetylhydrolase
MPAYSPGGPGGKVMLTILSEAFFKWSSNLNDTRHILSPPATFTSLNPYAHFFYAPSSAHLSQSDFGILFPWSIRRFLKVEDPERIVKLNVRAILQSLRENGHIVADTSVFDMDEETAGQDKAILTARKSHGVDSRILDRKGGISGWMPISPAPETDEDGLVEESRTLSDEVDETGVLGEVRM